jgi:hypothetical protein
MSASRVGVAGTAVTGGLLPGAGEGAASVKPGSSSFFWLDNMALLPPVDAWYATVKA